MKQTGKSRWLALLCILVSKSISAQSFIHPGLINNRDELAFIRQKVTAGEAPWAAAYETLRQYPGGFIRSGDMRRLSRLDYQARPYEKIVTDKGSGKTGPTESPEMIQLGNDMQAAYSHAWQWYIEQDRNPSGAVRHAEKAVEILDAWASTLTSWTGTSLFRAGSGPLLGLFAAEILRYTYKGWAPEKITRFEQLIEKVFWPVIARGYPENSNQSNNNQEAWTVAGRMAMGIFLSDRAKFENGVAAWRKLLPKNIAPDGFNYETCRDLSHAQIALAALALGAEMAWKQGIDLYGELDNRLLKGAEYHIPWMLGEPGLPDDRELCRNAANPVNSGRVIVRDPKPFYELVYNHYHHRKGLPAEATWRLISSATAYPADAPRRSYRPEFLVGSYGGHTLTHARLPAYPAGHRSVQPTDTFRVAGESYPVAWLFREDFSSPQRFGENWLAENGNATTTDVSGGRLRVVDAKGATFWFRPDLPANVIVRFKVRAESSRPDNKNNFNLISHARATDGSPLVTGPASGRSGAYKEYHTFPNYIATFTYDHSRIRKNPGFRMLSGHAERAVADHTYELVYTVLNGRIRYYVDGRKIHDVEDTAPLPGGKFGIRTWNTAAWWDDVQIGEIITGQNH